MAAARSRGFQRDEVLCHAGDPADSLHLVESGHLAVRGSLSSGATATFTILSAGDYFGELALLRRDHRRTASVVAIEPSRTMSIAGSAFQRLCAANPRVEHALSVLLADRVEKLSRRLLETMFVSLDRRLYRRLVDLATSYGVVDNRATIPLSQASLADIVGATRPSINQVLQRLVNQRLIEIRRGRIELLDVDSLAQRCRD